ncbi:MAG TPA: alpha/beta hydrolase [Candidatus Paceibacterota bacterium]|nr:alpha/beta hydrolase [Candidatus Paceibacterota bacterium]
MIKINTVIDNILLSYYFAGEKGKKSILFLHGWRSESLLWEKAMLTLAGAGFSLYALDLPGFGYSEYPEETFGVSEYADIVKKFILKFDLTPVILVGHSFGGRISIKLAAQDPELVSKVVLVDSAGFIDTSLAKKIKGSIAKILKPVFKIPGLKSLKPKLYNLMGAGDYLATPQLTSSYIKIVREDLSSDMEQIDKPTLIFWGDRDKTTPVDYAKRMNNLIKGSQLEIVPGGHFSFLDSPIQFQNSLLKFVK